jgi:predicted permease
MDYHASKINLKPLNFMIAEKYQQQPRQVASIVFIGNIASLITIPAVLFFLLG